MSKSNNKKELKLPNAKQILFCETYVKTLNVKGSYEFAYNDNKLKPRSALVAGHKLLKEPHIKNYINMLIKESLDILGNQEELKAALVRGAIDIALNENEYANARLIAMKMLGQGLGLFIDRAEITSTDIVVSRTSEIDE